MSRSWAWYATNFISLPILALWAWVIAKFTGFL
jgi:hypothetical protein